jgi:hypothetical protein
MNCFSLPSAVFNLNVFLLLSTSDTVPLNDSSLDALELLPYWPVEPAVLRPVCDEDEPVCEGDEGEEP